MEDTLVISQEKFLKKKGKGHYEISLFSLLIEFKVFSSVS